MICKNCINLIEYRQTINYVKPTDAFMSLVLESEPDKEEKGIESYVCIYNIRNENDILECSLYKEKK